MLRVLKLRTLVASSILVTKHRINQEKLVLKSYNLTSGLGLPLTWIMIDAVESTISSELLSLTRKTGWFEFSLSFLSAGVTETRG